MQHVHYLCGILDTSETGLATGCGVLVHDKHAVMGKTAQPLPSLVTDVSSMRPSNRRIACELKSVCHEGPLGFGATIRHA
jgi:hypothetical protein